MGGSRSNSAFQVKEIGKIGRACSQQWGTTKAAQVNGTHESDRMNFTRSRSRSGLRPSPPPPPSPSAMWTQISARAASATTTTTNLIHPSGPPRPRPPALLPLLSVFLCLSCRNSKSGIRPSVRSSARSTWLLHSHSIPLFPFLSCPSIYLVTQIVIITGVTLARRLLLLHSERQSDARFATSRLTCSPHRGSFAATCSPSANAAAAFSASLASVSICSSASRSRCC